MSHEAARSKLQDLEEKEAAQDEPLPKPGDILSSPPKTPRLEDALEMPRSSARLRRALEDAQAAGLGEARPKQRLRFAFLAVTLGQASMAEARKALAREARRFH